MASVAGCTDIAGGETDVLLDLAASNLTNDEQTAQISIEDSDGETIYSDVFDLDVSDEDLSLLLQGIITAQDGEELTASVVLPDHGLTDSHTFSVDCPEETAADGVDINDQIAIVIRSTDEVEFSHRGCA